MKSKSTGIRVLCNGRLSGGYILLEMMAESRNSGWSCTRGMAQRRCVSFLSLISLNNPCRNGSGTLGNICLFSEFYALVNHQCLNHTYHTAIPMSFRFIGQQVQGVYMLHCYMVVQSLLRVWSFICALHLY
jgi:hypothetical protein